MADVDVLSWRRRSRPVEVHHEHTKEVVRESLGLSPEAHAMVTALQNRVSNLASEVEAMRADLIASRRQIDALRTSMSEHSIRVLEIVKGSLDAGDRAGRARDVA